MKGLRYLTIWGIAVSRALPPGSRVGAVDSEFKLSVKSSKGYGSYIFEVGGSSVGYAELFRLYSVISSELALYY